MSDHVLAFSKPLRFGFIHEAGGTIAQRTGIAAGIAPNARRQEIVEKVPLLLCTHGLYLFHVGILIDVFLLFNRVCQHLIMNHRVAVYADAAILLQDIFFGNGFFTSGCFDRYLSVRLGDVQNLFLDHGIYFAFIDHAVAGNADDVELIALDFVLKDVGHDIA